MENSNFLAAETAQKGHRSALKKQKNYFKNFLKHCDKTRKVSYQLTY